MFSLVTASARAWASSLCGCGGVQDGEVEMSQESLKQVDYDYKNRLEGMMRKISWMLLGMDRGRKSQKWEVLEYE